MPRRFIIENAGLLAVILVSFVFAISRMAMPIKFDGSYIDEYWHITSAISLIESGKYAYFYNDTGGYDRGLLMSLWAGFWMALFGKSILVAKLAPISIGIINYFLFLYLSIKLIDRRRFQLLLVLLYTLSPWLLFNHSYIRFYVVNELFLLVLMVLGYRLYTAMRNDNWNNIGLFLLLVGILNILNLATTNDPSKYMLLIASVVMLASLFIYEFNTEPEINQGLLSAISGNILLSSKVYRTAIVFVVAVFGFIVLDAGNKIDFLLHGQLSFTSAADHKYSWFFWEKNGVISAFFVLAVTTFWWKNKGFERIILPVAGTLFLIHIAASEDLQIIRGLLYFMPLYYMAAVIGVSKLFRISDLRGRSEWLWCIVISSMFLLTTVTNVTRAFYWGPMIVAEVNYIEYSRLYGSVIKNCHGNLIVEAAPSSPYIARFYGVNVDYVLSTAENLENDGLLLIDESTGKYNTVWGSVPVITDIYDLNLPARDICLIVRVPSKKRFLPSAIEDRLQSVDKSWHFANMDLYILKQGILKGNQ